MSALMESPYSDVPFGRKSAYRRTYHDSKAIVYYSYHTPVLFYHPKFGIVEDPAKYSVTTSRHTNLFRRDIADILGEHWVPTICESTPEFRDLLKHAIHERHPA